MRLCSGIFIVASLAFPLHAQQFTEKIDVSIVNVDVTVTSRGEPVRGLTRDDFEVLEDGRLQTITNFYAVENKPALRAQSATPAGAADVADATDERFRRKVLVIVDNVHTSKLNRNRALEKLERFIDDHFAGGDYDWSIAVAGSRLQLVLPLTSDKDTIHTAINIIRKEGTWRTYRDALVAKANVDRAARPASMYADPFATFEGHNMDSKVAFMTTVDSLEQQMLSMGTVRAIREATRSFASTSGRKIILLLSSGIGSTGDVQVESIRSGPQMNDDGAVGGPAPGDPRYVAAESARFFASVRDTIIREANASNVSVYIINPEGLVPSMDVDNEFAPRPTYNGPLYWLARETGGILMPGNRPELSLQQFDKTSSNFYSLAYRPDHGDDRGYHRITVRLKGNRKHELRYRDGYLSLSSDLQVMRSLLTPFSPSMHTATIPFTATAGEARAEKGGLLVPIEAHVPLKDLQFLPEGAAWRAHVELYVSIFDQNGANIALRRFSTVANAPTGTPSEGELIHNASIHLTNGKPHTIVVAVRDLTTDALGMWRHIVK
ncbi:MAG: VWA domain-containing protein [Acidobacteriota bacterium]